MRRMKVSFPSGGGTGVGYSPISLRSKRGSLQDHSCRSQVKHFIVDLVVVVIICCCCYYLLLLFYYLKLCSSRRNE